ncbi:Sec-independent protein translocase subunit TatA/TatB [Mucilaginibacter paludis]|uniref:Sec-independent translocation protein mttA/Hcf106 n=1 Tax=Mucilaginibacter paludis DSM 18603 TaxID=714943 RepID=H1XZP9_9SPHI|nr:twin-arginine translocase TatA/TatE family subunit [Mucilaginibacter paludis]EHQ27741.1 sec-independent translocation protein mttA/Hcf106 [Mucilaginibacter paludis DSM 18603]
MINATLLFLSGPDMIIIAVIALFLFGGRKIPEFARGLGQSIRHFKEGSEGKDEDANKEKK